MIHTQGNVAGFELCQISHTIQCPSLLHEILDGRNCVFFDCGTCLLLSEQARRSERSRYEKAWTISWNSQGNTTAPIQSRAEFPQELAKLCDMKKEAAVDGHPLAAIIRPDVQMRQRQGQQFQRHNEPPTGHATQYNRSANFKHGETCFVPCRSRFRLE